MKNGRRVTDLDSSTSSGPLQPPVLIGSGMERSGELFSVRGQGQGVAGRSGDGTIGEDDGGHGRTHREAGETRRGMCDGLTRAARRRGGM